jgi:hypothetical protein
MHAKWCPFLRLGNAANLTVKSVCRGYSRICTMRYGALDTTVYFGNGLMRRPLQRVWKAPWRACKCSAKTGGAGAVNLRSCGGKLLRWPNFAEV